MSPENMSPMMRVRTAISVVAQAALANAQALCVLGDLNPIDVALGIARGVLEGAIGMVPIVEVDQLPREVAKCYRAAIAGRKAINEELGRTIEVVGAVPRLNGKAQ